ncbi:sulfurtransferase TusA family protein [Streptomyces sp. NPDC014676]|uniref:sulfurtransferase TusA family protein n=1 Tax=Streptomyces sp. NPDC014676 TaxID=3364879 RepID=UPI0036F913DC
MTTSPPPAGPTEPALTVDGTGLICVTFLLRLRERIDGAPPGTLVHVIATDPAAPLDLPAWCHMTGHAYLGPVPGERPVYALRLTAGAHATRPDAPWHPVRPEAAGTGGKQRWAVRAYGSPGKSPACGF